MKNIGFLINLLVLLIIFAIFSYKGYAQTYPGGVSSSNMTVWLRADTAWTPNVWTNLAPIGSHFSSLELTLPNLSSKPELYTNISEFNFNNAVKFPGNNGYTTPSNSQYLSDYLTSGRITFFGVSDGEDFDMLGNLYYSRNRSTYGTNRGNTGNRYKEVQFTNSNTFLGAGSSIAYSNLDIKTATAAIVGGRRSSNTNRSAFINGTYITQTNNQGYITEKGKYFEYTLGYWVGPYYGSQPIPEVIWYNESLSDNDINKINTYFAIKYGITLYSAYTNPNTKPTAQNYVASDGTLIYNAANAGNFIYNIFGLGRDNNSAKLHQRISHSVNLYNTSTFAGQYLTVSTNNDFSSLNTNTYHPDINLDKKFIMYSDNGSDFNSFTGYANLLRSLKIWRAQETGNYFNTLQYQFSNIPAGYNDYFVIIADDSLLTTNVRTIALNVIGDVGTAEMTLNKQSINGGITYFTIAYCARPLVKNLKTCFNDDVDLAAALLEDVPANTLLKWYLDNSQINEVATPATVGLGTYYAFYIPTESSLCTNPTYSVVQVVEFQVSDPEYIICERCPSAVCNPNTYILSDNPKSIEYDNIVSSYHSTILKEVNGNVKVWGENANPNHNRIIDDRNIVPDAHIDRAILTPIDVIPANGFNYSGSILKFTAGSNHGFSESQFVILTTEGLYAWGWPGSVLSADIKSDEKFGKVAINGKSDGLPVGISPSDVKMLFGSFKTLAIVTCIGETYVLSQMGSKNGDGTSESAANNRIWHRVKTGSGSNAFLNDVIAVRGTPYALMALTANGDIYTWGTRTYLGNNTNPSNRTYATKMTLPSGATPKLIGMTVRADFVGGGRDNLTFQGHSYYMLSIDGKLYSLGFNNLGQLGTRNLTNYNSWQRPLYPNNTSMDDIAWISPQEHDATYPVINAINNNGDLISWGSNAGVILGADGSYTHPIVNGRGLSLEDRIYAVETGGHTSIAFKMCSNKYGYLGHKIYGSMGDDSWEDDYENEFEFEQTAKVTLCGGFYAPEVKENIVEVCPFATYDINDLVMYNSMPLGATGVEWWTTTDKQAGTRVADPSKVEAGTYYVFWGLPNNSCCNEVVVELSDSPLPVELLEFKASQNNNSILLEWTTASEVNNDYFTIEKSLNGSKWEAIGIVDGSGTSNVINTYAFVDNNPINGSQYYRLKQTDCNGAVECFNPICVNYNPTSKTNIHIYPNPVIDFLNLNILDGITSEIKSVIVRDTNGKLLFTQDFVESFLIIDFTYFLRGLYCLQVFKNNMLIETRKIIKN